MVAFVIILVGMFALLQSVNIATEHNLKNQQRDEVVRVADDIMNDMRAHAFGSTFTVMTTVPSRMSAMNRTYSVRRIVTSVGSSERYQVAVRWRYKDYSASHGIVTVRGPQ
jgi:type IV pilus assembly protein PilV